MRSSISFLGSMLIAASAAAQCGPYVVDPDTAALWHFEEGAGVTASDSARRLIASLQGATFVEAAAPFGGSRFALDVGENRFASVSGLPVLNPHDGITVEAWVMPRSLASGHTSGIVRKNDAIDSENYSLEVRGSDVVRFSVNIGGSIRVASAVAPLHTNEWAHLAGTCDGTTVRLYVDGQLVASTNGPAGRIGGDSSPLFIGRGDSSAWFDGLVDEVRISDRARAPDELHAAPRQLDLFTDRRTARTGTRARATLHLAAPCGGDFALEITQENPTGSVRVLERRAHLVLPIGFEQSRIVRDHVFDGAEHAGTWRLHVVLRDASTGVVLHEEFASLLFTP
ncbi:MAG: LamG domain-containing protein [Planctomycetes bacterium]|nr:LamG domain-containing protein [Planctomycetota bacterium]MBI3845646.1 LamG domain-containing protein [Planctomycetota bacterium]